MRSTTIPPSIIARKRLLRRERVALRLRNALSPEARRVFDLVCLQAGILELYGVPTEELALGVRRAFERLRAEDARRRPGGVLDEQ
jgi:hypothetical protein